MSLRLIEAGSIYSERRQGPVPFPHVILERSEESHVAWAERSQPATTTKHGFVEGRRKHGLRTPKTCCLGQTTPFSSPSRPWKIHWNSRALFAVLCALLSALCLRDAVCQITIQRAAETSQESLTIARVQYYGGDYYTDPTSLPNLAKFASEKTGVQWKALDGSLSLLDPNLGRYPVLYLTGHGEIHLAEDEVGALRKYLQTGGFLIVNDNGPERSGNSINQAFRREIAKVLPENPLVELPKEHSLYHNFFDFPEGQPQIHRHDENQPPRAFGIFIEERLAVFYDWNSDIGNGWEDPEVHRDPPEKREAALQMGTNLLLYAMLQ